MPFDLGYDVAGLAPALGLISKAGIVTAYRVRWSPDRGFEQIPDLVLQDAIGRQADRVAGTLGFEQLVYLGIGEASVSPKKQMLHEASVTSNHRLQYRTPAISAVYVARSQPGFTGWIGPTGPKAAE